MVTLIKNWNINNIDNKINKLISNSIGIKSNIDNFDNDKLINNLSNDIYNFLTFCSICDFIKLIGKNNIFNDDIDIFKNKLTEADKTVQDYVYNSEHNQTIYKKLKSIKTIDNIILLNKLISVFRKHYIVNDTTKKLRMLISNETNIIKLMQYKHALAKLYGSKNYVSFILKDQLIHSGRKIINIIKSLINTTDEVYNNGDRQIINTTVGKYFDIDTVISNTFELISNIFCIEIKKNNMLVWDNNITCYTVVSDNKIIGYLYLDMYTRQHKVNNNSCICINVNLNNNIIAQFAILMNININYPYMSINELLSFYHELGHALHGMFGNGLLSGIYMENDFVETVAHIMELFCLDRLSILSNNLLPKDMENLIISNHKHNTCINIRKQCLMSFYDIYMHSYDMFKKFCLSIMDENNINNEVEYSILKYACNEIYNNIIDNKFINDNLTEFIDIKFDVTQHYSIIGQICAHNIYSQYKTKIGLLKKKLFDIGGTEKGIDILKKITDNPFSIKALCEYYDFNMCDNKFSEIKDNLFMTNQLSLTESSV